MITGALSLEKETKIGEKSKFENLVPCPIIHGIAHKLKMPPPPHPPPRREKG